MESMIEVETKFEVDMPAWLAYKVNHLDMKRVEIHQWYLGTDPVTRVRCTIDKYPEYELTIKMEVPGKQIGIQETTFKITEPGAFDLIKCSQLYPIQKYRYIVYKDENEEWIVDEFLGHNKGLIVCEGECKSESFMLKSIPKFVKHEIHHSMYSNISLAKKPMYKKD